MLLHRFPAETPFEERMRLNQLDYLRGSDPAQASLAEQYVGLPFEADANFNAAHWKAPPFTARKHDGNDFG